MIRAPLLVGLGAALFLGASGLGAQGRPELRGDVIVAERTAIYAGVGLLFPVGTYLRSGVVAAAGITGGSATFRADLVNIFHSDPFRESAWAPYGGGGVSFRRDSDIGRTNAFLLAILGVEGPPKGGFAPAIELGLGGGVRAGVVLRRTQGKQR